MTTSMGSSAAPKEQMDIYSDGKNLLLNDYRELYLYDRGTRLLDRGIQDKGHLKELQSFGDYLKGNVDAQVILSLWQKSRLSDAEAGSFLRGFY